MAGSPLSAPGSGRRTGDRRDRAGGGSRFIDLHAHGQSIPADRMQAFDGVTTTLDLEAGVLPVASWYRRQASSGTGAELRRRRQLGVRAHRRDDRLQRGKLAGGVRQCHARSPLDRNVASDTEVAGILDRLANGLNEGGIGIGILNAYAPGAGVQELTAVCQLGGGA
jgi:hypothetical protein